MASQWSHISHELHLRATTLAFSGVKSCPAKSLTFEPQSGREAERYIGDMLILNPNPCFSRTLTMTHFERGAVMRTPSAEVRAGGKGIDAARVAHCLKRKAPLIVLVGDRDADAYCRLLFDEKADFRYTTYLGSIRVATMYVEVNSAVSTVVNEEGPTISGEDWDTYLAEIEREIKPGEIVACMGSFPHGVTQDSITQLVNLVHQKGSLLLMDTAPHYLSFGLFAGVDIVSPNLDEAEAVINAASEDFFTGDNHDGIQRAKNAAVKLCEMGVKVALVHAGDLGTAIAYKESLSFIPSFPIKVVSAIGAGDSLAAGFALKSEEQGDVTKMDSIDWKLSLMYGTATASAACEKGRAGDVDANRVAEIFEAIKAS